jgi:SAM-dependent methyltransferase
MLIMGILRQEAALMDEQPKRVHLGCGLKTPGGWINLDGSWNAWLGKYPTVRRVLKALDLLPSSAIGIPWSPDILIHDVRKPLPFHDNSIWAIYASHLLEHLYLQEGKRLLKECFRILKPGGILRMVVPDLKAIVMEYMDGKPFNNASDEIEELSRADRLNKRLAFRSPNPISENIFYRIYAAFKDFHSHKWMYDADSLIWYFKWADFVDVHEMQFGRSRIEGIAKIEEEGRGIYVEGVKPIR